MGRTTQHALLFLLGAALLRIAADDTYLRYVRPGHRWLLIGAGAVMVVLAAVAVLRDVRSSPDAHGHGDGHAHGAVERHVPWLLLAPVLVLALVAPPALGADAVAQGGVSAPASPPAGGVPGLEPLPDGPATMSVAELVKRAVWERGSMDGREVVLVGFTVPGEAGGVELARLSIFCCAADARVNVVELTGAPATALAALPPDTWLEVRGTVEPGSAAGRADVVPTVVVGEARAVPAPADPYEF
ncbi:TIGR03943 family putative permease subunit [Pseudonocardia humida]|uniref:TIGR03943 family protein n=1 Tax=Pseudonocardia humida TaxID=2800819 RepID=A0ABT1AC07_9PSEU|nr:TIGR03943 family protein [Pseudonocardia humida]MCO1660587.1 TIGR03943 family protein [Pseudonocardia humida]